MMGLQIGLFFTACFYFTSSIDVGSEFTFVNSASFEDKGNEKMNSLNHLLNIIQIILTGPSTHFLDLPGFLLSDNSHQTLTCIQLIYLDYLD